MKRVFILLAFLCYIAQSNAQFSIKGFVFETNGNPLSGATVMLSNSFKGAITNNRGEFIMTNFKSGKYNLTISYLGYSDAQKTVEISSSDVEVRIILEESIIMSDEVVVTATRASNSSPIAFSNVNKESIRIGNNGRDLPYLLDMQPSVVVSSYAGNGVGQTSIRIRGTDMSRINVTINGIPFNDGESQEVWWVDLPDIAASVDNIQIQRGIGTSSNGPAAFGASINLQTQLLRKEAYTEINSNFGSFNTWKNSISVGSGLLKNNLAFDVRFSKISSDGYMNHSGFQSESYFITAGYYGNKSIIKANIFSGIEKTQLSWDGVPGYMLDSIRTYNGLGLISDSAGILKYYDNETDNYRQTNFQLMYMQELFPSLTLNISLHYTNGKGYYEQYKSGEKFSKYGLPDIIGISDTLTRSDFVRQKRGPNNDFYGITYAFLFKENNLEAKFGGAFSQYIGNHFGKIIWAKDARNLTPDYEWYRNNGNKTDWNVYWKSSLHSDVGITAYADLQFRHINYSLSGFDDNFRIFDQNHSFNFFNPKAGFYYSLSNAHNFYISYSIANREPNRDNYIDAAPGKLPRSEKMQDIEIGYNLKTDRLMASLNGYYMIYKDQLVLTGQLNDVGSPIMINVPKSYRLGVEISGKIKPAKQLTWEGNICVSNNKIINYTQYIDNWDTGGQDSVYLGTTDISFSPSVVFASKLMFQPFPFISLSHIAKYVGRQYLDNSSNSNYKLDPYFINDLRLGITTSTKHINNLEIFFQLNNLFNEMYSSSAWVYRYSEGGNEYKEDGFYPQAGLNFFMGISFKF